MMISIIDCGMGNLGSVVNMLKFLGKECQIIKTPEEVMESKKIIFPGVGSWDNGIKKIQESRMLDALTLQVLHNKIPFLGICLGMQLLFDSSEEGSLPGLGWVSGEVKKFKFEKPVLNEKKINIPHMGWNTVKSIHLTTLNDNLESKARFYFVHSYYVNCFDKKNILMTCNYGEEFVCAVNKDNIWGVQFHPEKSHKYGMQLMKNFTEL